MINGVWLGLTGVIALLLVAIVLYLSDKKSGQRKFSKICLGLALLAVGGGIVLALVQQSQPAPEMMSGGIGTIDPQEWDQLSKKIEENPKDVEALARMAHLELQKQNFERVAELSKQILAIQPKHAETFAHLGMLHFAMGEMQGAIDFFNKALKIDPKNQEATLFKGIVQSQMGKK